jgi:type VI secretion system protein ImpA
MSDSDLQRLLEPVSAELCAGPDLDGTLALSALESAAQEPDEAVVEGVEQLDERNWRELRENAIALLEQSKDLRVASVLARSALHCDELSGFSTAVSFMSTLAQRYWSTLYPPLDPDAGDATMRIHAIQELVSTPLLARLRNAQVAQVQGVGTISVNDLLTAGGSPRARAGGTPVAPQHVLGALDRLGAQAVRERWTAVHEACAALQALVAFVARETGEVLQLGPLTAAKGERKGLLDEVERLLGEQLARLEPVAEPESAVEPGAAPAARSPSDTITRREDVVAMLDKVCAYYARTEPSSPVPLLLERAKRLATMSFVEIVRDLADQGLPQVATVAGFALEDG